MPPLRISRDPDTNPDLQGKFSIFPEFEKVKSIICITRIGIK